MIEANTHAIHPHDRWVASCGKQFRRAKTLSYKISQLQVEIDRLKQHTGLPQPQCKAIRGESFSSLHGQMTIIKRDDIHATLRFSDGFSITLQQLRVLHGRVRGLSNAEIAKELYVAERTVKSHIKDMTETYSRHTRRQEDVLSLLLKAESVELMYPHSIQGLEALVKKIE